MDILHKTAFLDGADKYDVVGYLYATALMNFPTNFILTSLSRESWDKESNWIGSIAVSNDQASKEMGRREIYVAWRGTIREAEWVNDLGAVPVSVQPLLSPGKNAFHFLEFKAATGFFYMAVIHFFIAAPKKN